MRRVIKQTAVLPSTAEKLFESYLDPEAHGAFTGAPVTISETPGSEFRAFDGALTGMMLVTIKPRLVVQSWRSMHFEKNDPDSTLILTFTPEGDSGRIDLVHLDVPEQDFEQVKEGWEKYYWMPWREYLSR